MGLINKDTFVCLDCETTGLDPAGDRIIEFAALKFTFTKTLSSYETLIDPECEIPAASIAIHHISQEMVQGKPTISKALPEIISFVGSDIIIGHGIRLDISFLAESAKRHNIACPLQKNLSIDTLRLARLYGESPTNSLEKLREHFNIRAEGAHRAMSDVIVNIGVFKYLCQSFKTTEQVLERLKKPILLKAMPLGKHKGRPFSEIPTEYLRWAAQADFDEDLLFSVRTEISRRKKGESFMQSSNPFSNLE